MAARITFSVRTESGEEVVPRQIITVLAGATLREVTETTLDGKHIPHTSEMHPKWGYYMTSIAGYEKGDATSTRGWTYTVNDAYPETSAEHVKVADHDVIEWIFVFGDAPSAA